VYHRNIGDIGDIVNNFLQYSANRKTIYQRRVLSKILRVYKRRFINFQIPTLRCGIFVRKVRRKKALLLSNLKSSYRVYSELDLSRD